MNALRARRMFVLAALCLYAVPLLHAQTVDRTGMTSEQLFKATCAACHAPDGAGQPESVLGFKPPDTFPDFTDCAVSSVEPNLIWLAVIHGGGRARGLSHLMPAFGDILTDKEIAGLVNHLHSLCAEPGWPNGNLNFPRAFFTEKAFPENETVYTVSAVSSRPRSVQNKLDLEHRIGKRAHYEFGVPFDFQQGAGGPWSRGIGDINLAYRYTFYDNLSRGSIAAAGTEVTFPTGNERAGLGGGVTVFEAFGMFGQALPGLGFIQLHAGFGRPADHALANNEVFWRTAIGKTLVQNKWGRAWTPMVEVLGAKELGAGAKVEWDIVPEMQVTLSVFQHIRLSVGMQIPVSEREGRGNAFMSYLLWDWFDGGFFSLWRAH